MLAAILTCGTTTVLTSCADKADNPAPAQPESGTSVNKKITDGNYDESLAVECINGTFVGRKTDNVITYKGIPFVAQQPVGALRWKAPVEYTADDGVYEAYENEKGACQPEGVVPSMGEDCLYLNVWKAATEREQAGPKGKAEDTSAEKKPVLVWIHGGAFVGGGTGMDLFDCTNFVKENPDVIVVTVAYRLGVMGFLHLSHLPDGKAYPDAQNLGLLDQQMALKWVHENIEGFGGDPDNVTIWGESAGAASCTLQALIDGSQDYFQKIIAQSGSPAVTRSTEEAIACTDGIMKALGCKTVSDLLKVDAKKLVEAASPYALSTFPERDGKILPLEPHTAYANGAAKDITFLQGCNKDEFNFFALAMGTDGFMAWAADRKAKKFAQMTEDEVALVNSYLADQQGENWEPDCRLFTQSWFLAPCVRMSENQTNAGGKSYTYFYRVEASEPKLKAAHGEELPIVFCHPDQTDIDPTFCKTMRKMWVEFAKTGNPSLTAEQSPDGQAKEWPLYDTTDKKVMKLDVNDIRPAKESEVKIVDWNKSYFLTKYYMF
jgi:para-nitrobenzyl esterase